MVSVPIEDQNSSSKLMSLQWDVQKRPPSPGETLPPSLPAHSIIIAYEFAWPVGMDHTDDLSRWYQFYL